MDIKKGEKLLYYLKSIYTKYNEISDLISNPDIIDNQTKFRNLTKELSKLKPLNEKYTELNSLIELKNEAEEFYNASEETDMKELAQEEIDKLSIEIKKLHESTEILLASDESEDNRNVFLEIRAGAGGNEASLFASDLLRMYSRIAERKLWKSDVISTAYSSIGGIKEIILHIKGKNVNKYLKYESGVHRVQRVPVTESSGRIHTSTVTVAVMPEVEDIEVEINPKEIRIDTYRSSGAGGQHVNKTDSAIRITHFPTGIVVCCQDEKSQHKNKERAMKILKSRLYEFEKAKQEKNTSSNRKSQIGTGDRSEKIRTYNFPQSRVTDHRVSNINFNIENILDGNFDNLVKKLIEIHTKKSIEEKLKQIIS
jgi:peptide chain release factor 1